MLTYSMKAHFINPMNFRCPSHRRKGVKAVRFVVWAPRAKEVYLTGDFNNWNDTNLPLKKIGNSGLWNICVTNVEEFHCYKYRIISQEGGSYDESRPPLCLPWRRKT